jgi:arylsulfatase A-like enzyme
MKAIVIVANGWNAGWLGCFGNEWLVSPHLDRLAAESVVFDQHFAVNPSPGEWRRSLTSGCFEFTDDSGPKPSLIQSLRPAGIHTVRLHDVRSEAEARSWGTFPNVPSVPSQAEIPGNGEAWDAVVATRRHEDAPPGEAMSAAIADQLASLANRDRWLLWIETDRLIPPWSVSLDYFDRYVEDMAASDDGEPPQPWDEPPLGPMVLSDREIERLHGTFASVVTEWDADLGRWFDLFRKHGLADSAIWIVTAGHGMSLGEHHFLGPAGPRPYEELGHVPLIVRMPAAEQAGRRISELTASIDLLPTLADAFGATPSAGIHGMSLRPLMHGLRKPIRSYLCQKIGGESALRTPEWALLHGKESGALLFRKPEDRWEVNDARKQHLEWAEHLQWALLEFIRSAHDERSTPPVLKDYDDVVAPIEEESSAAPRQRG